MIPQFAAIRTLRKATAVMRHSPGLRRVLAVLPSRVPAPVPHGPGAAVPPGGQEPGGERPRVTSLVEPRAACATGCTPRHHAVPPGPTPVFDHCSGSATGTRSGTETGSGFVGVWR